MKRLRIGLAGLNQTPLDWAGNLARIRKARDLAREQDVQLLCLPELAVSGYGCEDYFLHPDTCARSLDGVRALARECGREALLVGLPFSFEGYTYNCVAVLCDGAIQGLFAKVHLAREGIHYEPRWFRSWEAGKLDAVEIDGTRIPIGSHIYSALGLRFSMEICEDAWVAPKERPCRFVSEARWIFNASASHFSMGKADIREKLVVESSRRFGIGYAYANLVGCESGRAIYDGELLVAEDGRVTNRSSRLYLDEVTVLAHDICVRSAAGARGLQNAFFHLSPDPPRERRRRTLHALRCRRSTGIGPGGRLRCHGDRGDTGHGRQAIRPERPGPRREHHRIRRDQARASRRARLR